MNKPRYVRSNAAHYPCDARFTLRLRNSGYCFRSFVSATVSRLARWAGGAAAPDAFDAVDAGDGPRSVLAGVASSPLALALALVLLVLLSRFAAASLLPLNDSCARGERGGTRREPEPAEAMDTGDGGTKGKAERMDSARLDVALIALMTETRDERGGPAAMRSSARCCCCCSTPCVGTVSVGRGEEAGKGTLLEPGGLSGAVIGDWGTSLEGGASSGREEVRGGATPGRPCDEAAEWTEPGFVPVLTGRELMPFSAQDFRRGEPVSPKVADVGAGERGVGELGEGVCLSLNGSPSPKPASRPSGCDGTGGRGLDVRRHPRVDSVPLRRLNTDGWTEERLGLGVRMTSALATPRTCLTVPRVGATPTSENSLEKVVVVLYESRTPRRVWSASREPARFFSEGKTKVECGLGESAGDTGA